MARLGLLVPIIAFATGWLYLLTLFAPSIGNSHVQLSFPSNLEELQELAAGLKLYSVNHWWYVLIIFSSSYVYKQSFCIPGSLFLNMLSGALYGRFGGLCFACLMTAIGASCCYVLSRTFARELVMSHFPEKLEAFERKVQEKGQELLYYMLFLRLIPVTPGWVVNLLSPLVGIPLGTFFITAFIGLGPYNFVGVSAGNILSTLTSVNDVFTWKTFLNIAFVGLVALGPAFLFKKTISQQETKQG